MNKINAQNIYKSFQGLEVLKGINLSVDEGEVVAVIGPSGGGKSTFLRCLNKLEIIDSGKIVIDGETLAETKPDGQVVYAPGDESRRIACKMGMVFQQFNLFPHMTVLENLIEAPVQVQKRNRESEGSFKQGRAFGKSARIPAPFKRRAAAACCHCKGAGNKTCHYAV